MHTSSEAEKEALWVKASRTDSMRCKLLSMIMDSVDFEQLFDPQIAETDNMRRWAIHLLQYIIRSWHECEEVGRESKEKLKVKAES